MSYMTVETTLVDGARLFSLQSTKDVQNGAIVGKGELVTGEREIYNALDDVTGGMYLVANPAWSYDDNRLVNQNEENFPLSETVERKSVEVLLPMMETADAAFLSQSDECWQENIDWMLEQGLISETVALDEVRINLGY